MTRWILAISLPFLFAACASNPGQPVAATSDAASAKTAQVASNGQQEKKSDLICTTGNEIGSHIPQRTCYTRKEAEQRKKAAQEAMQTMMSGPNEGGCSPSC